MAIRPSLRKTSSEVEVSEEETDEEDYAESEWDELDDQDLAERLAEKWQTIRFGLDPSQIVW
jgi:hypothetical protein